MGNHKEGKTIFKKTILSLDRACKESEKERRNKCWKDYFLTVNNFLIRFCLCPSAIINNIYHANKICNTQTKIETPLKVHHKISYPAKVCPWSVYCKLDVINTKKFFRSSEHWKMLVECIIIPENTQIAILFLNIW